MTPLDKPSIFEDAFSGTFSHKDETQNLYTFSVESIGTFNSLSGKLVACDPFAYFGDQPFEALFPVGQFSVELAIAKVKDDERVGFSRIKFSNQVPVKWQMGILPGEDVSTLTGDRVFSYGVDSGTGCFLDSSTGEIFSKYIDDDTGENYNTVTAKMQENNKTTWNWLLWQQDGSTVPMFTTGRGDGSYASYIGFDKDGAICRLVTDFALFEWPGQS
jgi:uncharacterized protein DUF4241